MLICLQVYYLKHFEKQKDEVKTSSDGTNDNNGFK